jgi:hypothetical protein
VNALQKLLDFLAELDRRRIGYRLDRVRDDAILVHLAQPGRRWEVEFFANGSVEVEGFVSAGGVLGGAQGDDALARIVADHDEAEVDAAPARRATGSAGDHSP